MSVTSDITLPQRTVLNSTMAYRESGDPGAPTVLFLHGNPTSSYIWRNVIPSVAPIAHCIAPDLIGFGQSGKPEIAYRFADHVRYFDAFLTEAGISSAYVVAQDWGTALAFHLAARKPEFVRGLAFMEFIRPMPTWDDFPAAAREIFQNFRTSGVGEKMILEGNTFVEQILPGATIRKLTDEEMAVYRAPFPTPESRRPTWRFPNELPIAGEPADVHSTPCSKHTRRYLILLTPSYFSWEIQAHWSRQHSLKSSRRGSGTAASYILVQALITFRRIILKLSVTTLNNG